MYPFNKHFPTVFDAGDTKTIGTRLALEYLQPPMGGQRADMRVWSVRSANMSGARMRRS